MLFADATHKCSASETCCPITGLCVTVGAACKSPCADAKSYCCPDAKHCVVPTAPGKLCSTDAACKAKEVCCPLTKLCVEVGAACVPPSDNGFLEAMHGGVLPAH
eukprot:SAG22_NODE_1774_length_3609_cov_3.611681_4_plen_105_part_00